MNEVTKAIIRFLKKQKQLVFFFFISRLISAVEFNFWNQKHKKKLFLCAFPKTIRDRFENENSGGFELRDIHYPAPGNVFATSLEEFWIV